MRVSLKQWITIINKLRQEGYKLIPALSLVELVGLNRNSLKVALWRLEKIGLICRVGKNWVCIGDCEPIDIVKVYFQPGYLSLEWLLFQKNIIDQAPYYVTVIWLKPTRKLKACGFEFEAHRIDSKYFFGFKDAVAYPEKALLDLIYIRKKFGYTINFELLNIKRLIEYSRRFPKWVQKKIKIMISSTNTAI